MQRYSNEASLIEDSIQCLFRMHRSNLRFHWIIADSCQADVRFLMTNNQRTKVIYRCEQNRVD
jgi:hypothetical protein